jgi:superfamily II DNA/RNA helicase
MQEAMHEAFHASGHDLILLSPAGSGKTIAYLYPLLEHLNPELTAIQAIVLVPSRELAIQTQAVVRSFGSPFQAQALYGGRPLQDEVRMMQNQPPHLLIATPGRMADHLRRGTLQVQAAQWLVVDEFDKSLELGFQDEMEEVISFIPNLQRRILLSATRLRDIPSFLGLQAPQYLDFLQEEERLRYHLLLSHVPDKLYALYDLLCHVGHQRCIVFLNHRDAAERVANFLREKNVSLALFHGGLEQDQRERALIRFVGESANILVCTDLGARGLDIPTVDHVIHYHLPTTREVYVHRNGRATRWDRHGEVTVILNEKETLPDFISSNRLEELHLPKVLSPIVPPRMSTIYIGKGKQHKISKGDILGLFCRIGGLAASQIGHIDIRPKESFCAVEATTVRQLLPRLEGQKIKGIKTIYREMH